MSVHFHFHCLAPLKSTFESPLNTNLSCACHCIASSHQIASACVNVQSRDCSIQGTKRDSFPPQKSRQKSLITPGCKPGCANVRNIGNIMPDPRNSSSLDGSLSSKTTSRVPSLLEANHPGMPPQVCPVPAVPMAWP